MSEREFRERLAKLRTLIAINDAKIMANPKPYLEDMSRRCGELLDVLEKVEYALSPDFIFDVWNECANKEAIQRPQDINGEALIRCNKALDVLREYKGG
tara:strand:- start:103 stop:399 length:297 start_codon:yes stop_codon:yes gene_type:complete